MSVIHDKPLRARVKLFGNLLGNVLHHHAGEDVLDAVEFLRKGFISLRKKDSPVKRTRLKNYIERLDEETMNHVIRAFTLYFNLVNIAEESFQHRERRKQVHRGGPLWEGSFDIAMRQFHDDGISLEQINELLEQIAYMPVFTAHPTESKRRTLLENLRRLFVKSEELNKKSSAEKRKSALSRNWKQRFRSSGVRMKYVR